MQSIIEDIFYGKRGNAESQNIRMSEDYFKYTGDVDVLYTEFLKILPEEQKEKFKKLCTAFDDKEAESALGYFKEGFKVGVLVGVECGRD